MTQASTMLIHRYSGVAIVVAVISGFGTFTATRFVRSKEHSDSNKYLRLAARRRMRCIQCLKFLWCQW